MLREACFVERLIETLLGQLVHAELQVLNLRYQAVFFQLHEHLLFDSSLILIAKLSERLREFVISFLLLGLIIAQFLLFLLYAAMVDLLEVSLLAQFVIS